jgi:hypothetical protein
MASNLSPATSQAIAQGLADKDNDQSANDAVTKASAQLAADQAALEKSKQDAHAADGAAASSATLALAALAYDLGLRNPVTVTPAQAGSPPATATAPAKS